jgi:NAD(P)-dependent dehydrogenase (short-subunit alcohol dehydrogenase family)
MSKRALVIGGAGQVGKGVSQAFRDAGYDVLVVDPAGGEIPEQADPALAERVGSFDLAVVSLSARGAGRQAGRFRAGQAASVELPRRLAALELAIGGGGLLIELAGSAVLEAGADEPGLIGRWQRGIHAGLARAGADAVLCAITGYVDPATAGLDVGRRIVEIAASGRRGLCRLDPAGGAPVWED